MTITDVFSIATTVILSVGGGGIIVFALSSWLGKIWANRLMEAERAKHAEELERLRSELHHESEATLTTLQSDLEIFKEKHLKGYTDKLAIYRLVTDVIVDALGDLDLITLSGAAADGTARWDRFNRGRMKAYGYLAMLAPQSVMDVMDALMDHLIQVSHGQDRYEWPKVRVLVLNLLNEIRKDIGIDASPIDYRGQL
jgi:hypothetical protein